MKLASITDSSAAVHLPQTLFGQGAESSFVGQTMFGHQCKDGVSVRASLLQIRSALARTSVTESLQHVIQLRLHGRELFRTDNDMIMNATQLQIQTRQALFQVFHRSSRLSSHSAREGKSPELSKWTTLTGPATVR